MFIIAQCILFHILFVKEIVYTAQYTYSIPGIALGSGVIRPSCLMSTKSTSSQSCHDIKSLDMNEVIKLSHEFACASVGFAKYVPLCQ